MLAWQNTNMTQFDLFHFIMFHFVTTVILSMEFKISLHACQMLMFLLNVVEIWLNSLGSNYSW